MTGDPRWTLASAVAAALLAGSWTERAMAERVAGVVGPSGPGGASGPSGRPRWVRPLVRRVLADHPAPPRDAPRALVAELIGAGGLPPALPDGRSQVVVRRWAAAPTAMAAPGRRASGVVMDWPVPALDTVADLARLLRLSTDDLDWFAGLTHRPRGAAESPAGHGSHHRYRWLAKAGGGHRLLEVPLPRLAAIQRHLLRAVLEPIPLHDAAHGFRRGRSAHSHAAVHTGRAVVLRLDLESFFATVTAGRVYGLFRTAGYPEPVAHALTGLVTTTTPRSVRSSCPGPGPGEPPLDPAAAARLDAALRTPHLAQGAPSSPALASRCLYRLDRRLAGLAGALDGQVRYSRYADDLVLSGDDPALARLGPAVAAIVTDCGLRVAPAKTRVLTASSRQVVTGLVVNDHVAVRRDTVDRVRAVVHDARVHGPAAANRTGRPDFREHLLGLVSWVAQTGTPRARAVAAEASEIRW